MKWWHISAVLCTYGFFKEFRPSEPFITPYLITFKNFTIKDVNEEIFPVGTYCYLALLVVVFLMTDFLRYKPVLVAGSVSGVITWGLLIWGKTIKEMQIVEFFYALFLATEVAYFSYIYAKVDKKFFQKVTSHTRAAILLGKAMAGLSSQLLIFLSFNYLQLNYFSVFGVGVTGLVVFFLPGVSQSVYFHRKTDSLPLENSQLTVAKPKHSSLFKTAFWLLYHDFEQAFINIYVLKWSAWWALATCGYLQVTSYCQLLWQDINQDENSTLYHGYVESVYAISGAAMTFGIGYLKIQWNTWGEIFLGILTISQGGFLFSGAYMRNLYLAYILFILYREFYEAAITVATCEVAKHIKPDSYALVFGVNTFAALIIQTILTAIVVETLQINIRHQFKIYGFYHFSIGSIFLFFGILRLIFFRSSAKM